MARQATKNGKASAAKPKNRITVKKTTRKATPTEIVIPAINMQTIKFRVVGDSPLVTHAWSAKARKIMLDKQQGKKVTKAPKDPWQDFCDSLYWVSKRPAKVTEAVLAKAKFGFPATAIKSAAVAACRGVDALKMTEAKQLIFVESDYTDEHAQDLIIIEGGIGGADVTDQKLEDAPTERKGGRTVASGPATPKMIESMVRLQTGVADLRYRGLFFPWSAVVRVQFDADNIAVESVINLINRAGLTCGICEWRPSAPKSSTGMWGRFHVESA